MPKLTSKFQNSGKETVFLVIFQLFITKFRSMVFEMKKGHFLGLFKSRGGKQLLKSWLKTVSKKPLDRENLLLTAGFKTDPRS